MSLMDHMVAAASNWLETDSDSKALARPVNWFRQKSGYAFVNRLVGSAIPFAPRNRFRVEEVKAGYVRASIALKGNKNHFGSLYAGAYFLVAEIPGGVLALFDLGPAYVPILKEMTLEFLQPANSDVTVEMTLAPDVLDTVRLEADETGRAAFSLEGALTDSEGQVVARSVAHYRVRKRAAV